MTKLVTKDVTTQKSRLSAYFDTYLEEFSYVQREKSPNVKLPETDKKSLHPKTVKTQLSVFTDTDLVKKNLKFSSFQLVNSIGTKINYVILTHLPLELADFIWMTEEFKQFSLLRKDQLVNQFPNETCVTFKHKLAETIYRAFGEVDW